ncbi:MAG: hypothetical protein FWD61_04890, partial [Phycisphaerales bacterium]|nr:hypothetical protein [Phycisphaerales bacterium]
MRRLSLTLCLLFAEYKGFGYSQLCSRGTGIQPVAHGETWAKRPCHSHCIKVNIKNVKLGGGGRRGNLTEGIGKGHPRFIPMTGG